MVLTWMEAEWLRKARVRPLNMFSGWELAWETVMVHKMAPRVEGHRWPVISGIVSCFFPKETGFLNCPSEKWGHWQVTLLYRIWKPGWISPSSDEKPGPYFYKHPFSSPHWNQGPAWGEIREALCPLYLCTAACPSCSPGVCGATLCSRPPGSSYCSPQHGPAQAWAWRSEPPCPLRSRSTGPRPEQGNHCRHKQYTRTWGNNFFFFF